MPKIVFDITVLLPLFKGLLRSNSRTVTEQKKVDAQLILIGENRHRSTLNPVIFLSLISRCSARKMLGEFDLNRP